MTLAVPGRAALPTYREGEEKVGIFGGHRPLLLLPLLLHPLNLLLLQTPHYQHKSEAEYCAVEKLETQSLAMNTSIISFSPQVPHLDKMANVVVPQSELLL